MNSTASPLCNLEDEIERNVGAALAEDVGSGDQHSPSSRSGKHHRAGCGHRFENAVLCGTAWFERCFAKLDPSIRIVWKAADGDRVSPNQLICEVKARPAPCSPENVRLSIFCKCSQASLPRLENMPTSSQAHGPRLSIRARRCPACAWPRICRQVWGRRQSSPRSL